VFRCFFARVCACVFVFVCLGKQYCRNVTTCVLRTLMPAYVALCDKKAIQCEETMLDYSAEIDACLPSYDVNGTCSPQCARLANNVSSRFECVCFRVCLCFVYVCVCVGLCVAATVYLLHACLQSAQQHWCCSFGYTPAANASRACGRCRKRFRK